MLGSVAPHWDFRRSATSAQLLARLGQERGLSLQACLAGTGITPMALADPDTEIEAQQELQLIRNLQQHAGSVPGLGLDAGLRYHLTAYGIWGFALISSPTFRGAAELGLRYMRLTYIFNFVTLEEAAGESWLRVDDRSVPEDVRQFLLERDVAAIRLLQLELFSAAIPIKRLEFSFARPVYARRFKEIFGVMPLFGRPVNLIVFDSKVLDLPLPQANERTVQVCEAQCRELLSRRRARVGVAARVRDGLLRQPGRIADMETIAAGLFMTSRTLRRRLEDEGTSYRALVDEVREILAEALLATTGISVEEIAARLGYSEAASFIHAFKRWKGVAPRAYAAR